MTTNSKSENTAFTLPTNLELGSTRAANPAFRLDLLRSLTMHPVLASSITSVSLVLLLLYGSAIRPMYEAEALVHVQPEPVTLLSEGSTPAFDSGKYDSFLQEQIQSMQRPHTISAALDRLPKNVWAEYGFSKEKATEQIHTNIKVGRLSTSYEVSLTLKGSDPDKVTELINAIAYTYLDLVHKEIYVENDERTGLLEKERERVANELRRDQDEQSMLGASLGLANPDGEGDPYEGELTALREQLVQARSAHEAAAARMASLKGQPEERGSALAAEADEAILQDTGLSALRSSVSQRRTTLRGQMSGMTPDNPLRRRDQEELTDLDHSLEEMTGKLRLTSERNLQEKLRADLLRTGDLEARINSQLALRTAAATNATPKLQRAAELNGDVKRLLLRQAGIADATRSFQLKGNGTGAVRLTLAAQVPTSAEGNHKQLFLVASFPLALLVGASAAAISHKRDSRIYNSLDIADLLGIVPLVTLPADDEVSEAAMAENVLRLAGAVTDAYRAKGFRAFLFTTVSASTDIEPLSRMLLEKLGQTGIDACSISLSDLLLPSCLDKRSDPETPNTAGNTGFPAVQTGPKSFADLNLASLQARHSLVLVKAAQPFHSGETEYVARCVDATILVVESAITVGAELLRAAESAHRLHVEGIGIVLQGVRKRYSDAETRELLVVCSTPNLIRESPFRDQGPLLKKCGVMVSCASESGTGLSLQPERDQASQASNEAELLSTDVRTPEQQQLILSAPPIVPVQPAEDKPHSCRNPSESQEFTGPLDKTSCCNKITFSNAMKSGCSGQTEKITSSSKSPASFLIESNLSSFGMLLKSHDEMKYGHLQRSGNKVKSVKDQSFLTERLTLRTLPEQMSADSIIPSIPELDLAPIDEAGILAAPVLSPLDSVREQLSTRSIAKWRCDPTVASDVQEGTVQQLESPLDPIGDLLEKEQSIPSHGVGSPDTDNPGTDDLRRRLSEDYLGLLRGSSDDRGKELRKLKEPEHFLPSALSQPFSSPFDERKSEKPSFSSKQSRSDSVLLVGPIYLELLDHSASSPTLQLDRPEKRTSTFQDWNLAGRDNVLTRPWGLLSRFQQNKSYTFPSSAELHIDNQSSNAV